MQLCLEIAFIGLDSSSALRLRRYHAELRGESGQPVIEAPTERDASLRGCIAGVGSSWDEMCETPRGTHTVERKDHFPLHLGRMSIDGAQVHLEWPADLPLGELLLLTLQADSLVDLSIWGRVVGVSARPDREAILDRRMSGPARPSRRAGQAA